MYEGCWKEIVVEGCWELDVVLKHPCVEQKHLLACSDFVLCQKTRDQFLGFVAWMFVSSLRILAFISCVVGGV